ncbi:MAG: tetratricopeptide repeat protein [Thermoanaerobaculia bacterium]
MESAAARPGGTRRCLLKRVLALALGLALAAVTLPAQDTAKMEAAAKRAFDSGRFKEAGDKYAKLAETPGLAPDRLADLHLQSAWSYYIAGSSKSAREQLKSALTARPDLQVIADFYSPDFANLTSAVRAEVAGANVPPIDVDELKRSARAKLADGKAEEALYDLRRASASNDPEVFRLLADANDRLGRTADADTARRRASDIDKGLVSSVPIGVPVDGGGSSGGAPSPAAVVAPLLENAEAALSKGDFRTAAAVARQASEADPRSAEAHRILGDAALQTGQDADAEREYTASIVLDSSNPRSELGLGIVAEAQRKWNTAASHYRRALELNPKSVGAARGLGRSMYELSDKSAARIAFGRAIEIDPASADAHNDFGVFLFRSDELERAQDELMEAVRLDPSRAVFHENLGRAFRKKGMWKEAERELGEATRLDGRDAPVWIALGQVRVEEKRFDAAAPAFSTALSLDPLSEEAASLLSATLAASGKLPEAEAALSKAIESNAKSPALWNNLGVVRTRRGNYPGAMDAFRKALGLDANFDAAKTNLARTSELAALEKAAS